MSQYEMLTFYVFGSVLYSANYQQYLLGAMDTVFNDIIKNNG